VTYLFTIIPEIRTPLMRAHIHLYLEYTNSNSYKQGTNQGDTGYSTQKIAKTLCERVFHATELTYWLDIHGGMSFGQELMTEMREGVKNCMV